MHSPYVGVLSILISRLNSLSEKFAEHWLRCGPRAQPVQAMRLAYMTDLTFIRSIESDVLRGVLKVFHDIYIYAQQCNMRINSNTFIIVK